MLWWLSDPWSVTDTGNPLRPVRLAQAPMREPLLTEVRWSRPRSTCGEKLDASANNA
jgi:hypothetical protein